MSVGEAGTNELLESLRSAPRCRQPAATLTRLREWITRSGMAIFDQGCISGANFLLYVVLARWLAPQEYGVFALVFSVYMLILGLHSGLVQEPMSVLAHVTYGKDLTGYCARLVHLNLVLSLTLAAPVVSVGVWFLAFAHNAVGHDTGVAFLSLAFSLPCLLLLWLSRRMAYLRLVPHEAAFNALFYLGLLLAGMALMKATQQVSVATAFCVMAGASGLAGGRLLGKFGTLRPASTGTGNVLRRHLEFGKWLLAVGLLSWLARDAYYVLAAGLIGPVEAGALRAVGNLVTPLEQVQTALGVMLLPWLSSLSSQGRNKRLRRRTLQITLAFTALSVVYLGALWPVAAPILNIAYQGKYNHFAWLVPWLVLPQILRAIAAGGILFLMVVQRTREVFYAGVGAGSLTVLGAVFVHWWSLKGLVCGLLLSAGASTLLVWFFYSRSPTEDGQRAQIDALGVLKSFDR